MQTLLAPVMLPGVDGIEVTAIACELASLVPHPLTPTTLILPEPVPKVTVMEVLPEPDAMLAPPGTVQLYEAAPATGLIE